MKRKTLYRLLAGLLAVAMPLTEVPVSHAAGSSDYVVLKDANGHVYDLGGAEIIIRNWWSDPSGERPTPQSEYDKARWDYIEWCEKTYNFTIKEQAISDWGSAPADYVDYVTTGGDNNYYAFVLRDDPAMTAAMQNGLMYDLNSLNCLDFSSSIYQRNLLYKQYSYGGKVFAMYGGYSEPRTGIFFNKRILKEAGINPDSIYDMQKKGTWTWKAWTDLMEKVQKDTDGDGIIDIAGFDANYGVPVSAAVYSNGSEYVGLENGKYTYKFEDPNTVEALEWITDDFKKYALVRPIDAQWDYYKEAFMNGECAFMPEDAYAATGGNFLYDMKDEIGFVMFPKGPKASDYTNCWSNNPVAIPACYDANKAWKIAFAYNLYASDVPGYENYKDLAQYQDGKFDSRSVSETIPMMMEKGMVTYHSMIPNLDMGAPFLWAIGPDTESISAILEANSEVYQEYIEEANGEAPAVTSFTISESTPTAFCPLFDGGILGGNLVLDAVRENGTKRKITLTRMNLDRYGAKVYLENAKGTRVEIDNAGVGKYKLVVALDGVKTAQKLDIVIQSPDDAIDADVAVNQTISLPGTEHYDADLGYWVTDRQWVKVTIPKAGYYYFDLGGNGWMPSSDVRVYNMAGEPISDYVVSGFDYPAAGTYYVELAVYTSSQYELTLVKGVKPVKVSLDSIPGGKLVGYTDMGRFGYPSFDAVKFKLTYADGSTYVGYMRDDEFRRINLSVDYYININQAGNYSAEVYCQSSDITLDVAKIPFTIKDRSEFSPVLKAGGTVTPNLLHQVVKVVIDKPGFYEISCDNKAWLTRYNTLEYDNEDHYNYRSLQVLAEGPMELWLSVYADNGNNLEDVKVSMTKKDITTYKTDEKIVTKENYWDSTTQSYDYIYFALQVPKKGTYRLEFDRMSNENAAWVSTYDPNTGKSTYLGTTGYINFDAPGTYYFRKEDGARPFYFTKVTDIVDIQTIDVPEKRVVYAPIQGDNLNGIAVEIKFADGTSKILTYGQDEFGTISTSMRHLDGSYANWDELGDLILEITFQGLFGHKVSVPLIRKHVSEITDVLHYGDSITVEPTKNGNSTLVKFVVDKPGTYRIDTVQNVYGQIYVVNGGSYYTHAYLNGSSTNEVSFDTAGTYYVILYNYNNKPIEFTLGEIVKVVDVQQVQGPDKTTLYSGNGAPDLNGVAYDIELSDGTKLTVKYGTAEWDKYVLGSNIGQIVDGFWTEVKYGPDEYTPGEYIINLWFVGMNNYSYSHWYTVKDIKEVIDITKQPEDTAKLEGETATFSVKATGNGLTYQWQRSTDGVKWSTCTASGAKTATVKTDTLLKYSGRQYRCVITDKDGNKAISDAATLTVYAPVKIVVEPKDVVVEEGTTALFGVEAAGDGLTYQWQRSADGVKWVDVTASSAKKAIMSTTTKLTYDGRLYRCVVTDQYGYEAISKAAKLSVTEKLLISFDKQPSNVEVKAGEKAIFTVKASGEIESYQWEKSNDGIKWTTSTAPGSKTDTMTTTAALSYNGRQYRCKITVVGGQVYYSDAATLTVQDVNTVAIDEQPADVEAKEGEKAIFTVKVSGEVASYQWQRLNGTSWVNSTATGSTTATMTTTAKATYDGRQYRCIITDKSGKQLITEAAKLTIAKEIAELVITEQPADVNIAEGEKATFTVKAEGDGLTYQWQRLSGSNWVESTATGSTTATMTTTAKATYNGRQYRCIITDKTGKQVISEAAKLTIAKETVFAITEQPANVNVAEGEKASFTVKAEGDGLTYQWQRLSGSNWVESTAPGSTTATMTTTAKATYDGRQYRCVVTDQNGNQLISEAAKLTIAKDVAFAITQQPSNVEVAEGVKASFTVKAEGEGLTYQWQRLSGSNWVESTAPGSTTATMTTTAKASYNGRQYRCVVTDQNGNVINSAAATLTVN